MNKMQRLELQRVTVPDIKQIKKIIDRDIE